MAKKGLKTVDLVCPGFTSDCLETLEEINMEAREAFLHAGGQQFQYIPCVNDSPEWIRALTDLAERHLQGWPTKMADNPMELKASRERALALGAKE
jgi:ferrochelatase